MEAEIYDLKQNIQVCTYMRATLILLVFFHSIEASRYPNSSVCAVKSCLNETTEVERWKCVGNYLFRPDHHSANGRFVEHPCEGLGWGNSISSLSIAEMFRFGRSGRDPVPGGPCVGAPRSQIDRHAPCRSRDVTSPPWPLPACAAPGGPCVCRERRVAYAARRALLRAVRAT